MKSRRNGIGSCRTRCPVTGVREVNGMFYPMEQPDVSLEGADDPRNLKCLDPRAQQWLDGVVSDIERHDRAPRDFEFSIRKGRLTLLSTRPFSGSAQARVQAAFDMAITESLLSRREALAFLAPDDFDVIKKMFAEDAWKGPEEIFRGERGNGRVAMGKVFFSKSEILRHRANGEDGILLIRNLQSDEADFILENNVVGALVSNPGRPGAGIVFWMYGPTPCIIGFDMQIDEGGRFARIGKHIIKEGDWISMDGKNAIVYRGKWVHMNCDIPRLIPPAMAMAVLSWRAGDPFEQALASVHDRFGHALKRLSE